MWRKQMKIAAVTAVLLSAFQFQVTRASVEGQLRHRTQTSREETGNASSSPDSYLGERELGEMDNYQEWTERGDSKKIWVRPFVVVISPTNTDLYDQMIPMHSVVQDFLLEKLTSSDDASLALTFDLKLAGLSPTKKSAGGSAVLPGSSSPPHTIIHFEGGEAESRNSWTQISPTQREMKLGILNILNNSEAELLTRLKTINGLGSLTSLTALAEMPPTSSPVRSPTASPSKKPTKSPTKEPTKAPTKAPTTSPTKHPTSSPTKEPTVPVSTTDEPTAAPTENDEAPTTQTEAENENEAVFAVQEELPTETDPSAGGISMMTIVGMVVLSALIVASILFVRKEKYRRYHNSKGDDDDSDSDSTQTPSSHGGRIASHDAQQAYDTSTIPIHGKIMKKKRAWNISKRSMFPVTSSKSSNSEPSAQDIFLSDPTRRELAAISELESGYGGASVDFSEDSSDPFHDLNGDLESGSSSSPFSDSMGSTLDSSIQKEVMSSGSNTIPPKTAYDNKSKREYNGVLQPTNFSARSFLTPESDLTDDSAFNSRGQIRSGYEGKFVRSPTIGTKKGSSTRRSASRSTSVDRSQRSKNAHDEFKLDDLWNPDDADLESIEPSMDCSFQVDKKKHTMC